MEKERVGRKEEERGGMLGHIPFAFLLVFFTDKDLVRRF